MKKMYTAEKNIQILISLLKEHNIKNIIASPGTTNISFVASVQCDDFFKIYSCVDERSAGYMACGLAAQTEEPIVIVCTGATASRNYIPGLTEAYYRKLPVIAITATQHLGKIGQNVAQVIDRTVQLNDIVKKSIQLESVYSKEDEWACNLKVNEAILETCHNGGGPVHINMVTTYSNDFSCEELPYQRKIDRITIKDELPNINSDKVAIFIGNHSIIDETLTREIEKFCEKYNGVVICDHTSNYHGKYKILGNLICNQNGASNLANIPLLIDIGGISGAYIKIKPSEVWRVNQDGIIRDTYKKITKIFELDEVLFFKKYNDLKNKNLSNNYYEEWKNKRSDLESKEEKVEFPFSNIWIAKNIINRFKENSIIHLGILNTLRSWNYFDSEKKLNIYCNTGGFGIDGIMSTAIGASLGTNHNVYCFIGDLAFFYDLNSIGNHEVKNNLRIMLINNGCGTEFHNYNHRAVAVATQNKLNYDYFAADGHYGKKSKSLVKHYAEDLGFYYLSADNKKDFIKNVEKFIGESSNKPIIFEVFTTPEDESEALKKINNLDVNIKSIAKDILGEKGKKIVKKILGK